MDKESLLTTKSETSFQNFFLVIHHEPKPGCSLDFDHDPLRELVECNWHKSTQELALDLNTSQTPICHHVKKIGKVSKLSIWVPHIFYENNMEDHIFIIAYLLLKQRNDLFLNYIITGDEKWVVYVNVQCKRQ